MIVDQTHQAFIDYPKLAVTLLDRAEKVDKQGVFLGAPLLPTNRYLDGYLSLLVMQYTGLASQHQVLEIGCGSLRSGYWIINYLNSQKYWGIEPNIPMLKAGIHNILTRKEIIKNPQFGHNDDFKFDGFGIKFDYVLACSIWSHAAKWQIEMMLDQFIQNTVPTGKFLTSYIPTLIEEYDYLGDEWVGKSHKSTIKGVVAHKPEWVLDVCHKKQLTVNPMPHKFTFGNQVWLCIQRG
jgi:hypothetical protein